MFPTFIFIVLQLYATGNFKQIGFEEETCIYNLDAPYLGAIFILRKGVLRFFEPPTPLHKDIFTT